MHSSMKSVLTPLDFLARSASVYRNRIAVVDDERRFTFAEFNARVHRQASALRASGVRPGDRVAVLALNSAAAIEAHFGVLLAGAVLVMLNTRLKAAELAWILNHCEARVAIADPQLAAELPRSVHAIADYEEWLAHGEFPAVAAPEPEEDGFIAINYTSGTTGFPKGVMYTHRGAYLNALGEVIEHGLLVDAADVPLQRLVLSVGGDGCGCAACVPAAGGSAENCGVDPRRRRDAHVRRPGGRRYVDPILRRAWDPV